MKARALVVSSSSTCFFIQDNLKAHKASSALRSSQDVPHLRVSSAILSNFRHLRGIHFDFIDCGFLEGGILCSPAMIVAACSKAIRIVKGCDRNALNSSAGFFVRDANNPP
jgi:hypothetical protein